MIFSHFSSLNVRRSACVNVLRSVQKISQLDSPSKFQMFTRGGPPTWQLHTKLYNFAQNILTNISTLGQCTYLKLRECLLYLSSVVSQFLDFIHCMVSDFIFYCVTMHTHTLFADNETLACMYIIVVFFSVMGTQHRETTPQLAMMECSNHM